MSSEERWGNVVKDLDWVGTDRLIRRAYLQAKDADQRAHSTLGEVITTIVGDMEWRTRPNRSLSETMLVAIGKLPKQFEQRKPEDKGKREPIPTPSIGRPERHLAEILYGYADDEVAAKLGADRGEFTYSDYIKVAKDLAGLGGYSEGSIKRLTRAIRQDLADILLDMEQDAISLREHRNAAAGKAIAALSPAPLEVSLIIRSTLAEQFHYLWNVEIVGRQWQRHNTICLVGEPGTGKSHFARELPALAGAIWVNADSVDALSLSLAEVLESYDVPVASLDTQALKREFGKLLARPGGPAVVVIDGIHDPQEIDGFVPQSIQARLIITSRTRPADNWSPILHVSGMEPDEATAMVQSLLPAVDGREAASLAACLGNRPLAIEQVCAFLRRRPAFTVADLLYALARDPKVALSPSASRSNAALTMTYKQILRSLAEEYPESYQLLKMLAFVPPLYVPHKLVMGFVARHLPIEEHELRFCELEYLTAMTRLQELCLLEESASGIRLNSLTKEILWDLVWEDLPEITNHYSATTDDVDESELEDSGWSPEEMASYGVIGKLFSTRIMEVLATKPLPDEVDQHVVRKGKVLTVDEWSALTEALWERWYRVEIIHHIMKLEDVADHDELFALIQPYRDRADEVGAQIPDRDAWWDRVSAFDFHEFLAWVGKSDHIDQQKFLSSISEGTLDEFMKQVTIFRITRAVWMLREDPIVETRLGRFDLRELYPRPEEPEHRVPLYDMSHPPVALALQGDCEIHHAGLVLQALGYADASELVRLIKFGNRDAYLKVLAGMTTVPVVGEQIPGTASWHLAKPFTPLFITASPEGLFATPEMIEAFRTEQLDFIKSYLQMSGITRPDPEDLDGLVNIRVWQESCYEFEHFTDEELADGIIAVHQGIEGWTRDEVIAALRQCRNERGNPKTFWLILFLEGRFIGKTEVLWANTFGTTELAEALWPALLRKIQLAMVLEDAPVPLIMQVINDVYHLAQQRRNLSFVLTEVSDAPDKREQPELG